MSQLPPRMHRYRRELEAAIAADRRRTRRRRLGGVAAAVVAVLVAVNLLPSGGERPGVAPASAVERAAQALQPRDGTILHVRMEGRQFDDERPDIHWSHESWTRVGEGAMRSIETQPDGTVAETAQTATTSSLWDADGRRVLEKPIPEAEQAEGGARGRVPRRGAAAAALGPGEGRRPAPGRRPRGAADRRERRLEDVPRRRADLRADRAAHPRHRRRDRPAVRRVRDRARRRGAAEHLGPARGRAGGQGRRGVRGAAGGAVRERLSGNCSRIHAASSSRRRYERPLTST